MTTTLTSTPHGRVVRRRFQAVVWFWRLLIGAFILLVALSELTWLAGAWAKANLAGQYPAPGQRVDVGGYQMHLYCTGEGSPTVIMEAGLNDFSVHWALVQPEVMKFTRVCTYDRAGLGWSDPSPRDRTRETIVDELHLLLSRAEIKGPYVLVGHSFGGLLVRLFAYRYPDEVLGMVLVDSAHEEQLMRLPAMQDASEQLIQQFQLFSTLSDWGLMALSPEQIPNRGLPDDALAHYRTVLATTGYFDGAMAESETFYNELRSVDITPAQLGDVPLFVLSRGQDEPLPGLSASENDSYEELWQTLQAELAGLSSQSRQISAKQSGHYIQLQQPKLVVDAIRQMVQITHE